MGAALGLVLFVFFKVGWQMSLSFSLIAIIPAVTLMAGFCGAVLGALFGFLGEGSTAGIYYHHLRQGHYLLMMEGPEKLVRRGQEVLKQYCLPKTI